MAKKKRSFMVYYDRHKEVEMLSDADAGLLFYRLCNVYYSNNA